MADSARGTPLAGAAKDTTERASLLELIVEIDAATPKRAAELLFEIETRVAGDLVVQDRKLLKEDRAVLKLAIGILRHADPAVALISPRISKLVDLLSKSISDGKKVAAPPGVKAASSEPPVADPVDPATGHLMHSHVDLAFSGGGIDFSLVRMHRSGGKVPNGPLGVAWDHSYNVYARELPEAGVVVSMGGFREDLFRAVEPPTGAPYYAPPDGLHSTLERISAVTGDTFELTAPDGLRHRFEPTARVGIHRIAEIRDRFGNNLAFQYDVIGRLERVLVNDPVTRGDAALPTRFVRFEYDAEDRIRRVGDSTGRHVDYDYDDYDDLRAITLPATQGYPFGRSVFYTYTSDTRMPHQLTTVIDQDGRRYVDVEYGAYDGFLEQGRVVRLRDDDGEWLFEYAELERFGPPDLATPTRYTRMVRPNGHAVELLFNDAGNVLVQREATFDEDRRRVVAETRTLCNADGALVARLTPGRTPFVGDGFLAQRWTGREQYLVDRGLPPFAAIPDGMEPTARQRRAFGNALVLVRRARANITWPPAIPAHVKLPGDIAESFEYDNPFCQVTAKTDPRDPTIVTRFEYGRGRTNVDESVLVRITYPATTRADGTTQPAAVEQFDYDELGRKTEAIDAMGRRLERSYYRAADTRPGATLSVTIEGHLARATAGAGTPSAATTTYDVNARGAPIKITNANGAVTLYERDHRDQPLSVTRLLERPGRPAIRYQTRTRYTAEGKPRRIERDLLDDDGLPLGGGVEVRLLAYNDSGQVVRDSIGGVDRSRHLVTRNVYDAEGKLVRTISPGNAITRTRRDRLGRPLETTRAFATSSASTTRFVYDVAGRTIAEIDARGHVTRREYDEFQRTTKIVRVFDRPPGVDARPLDLREGHTHCYHYDARGNVTLERVFGWLAPGQYELLSRTSRVIDELGREVRVIRDLFPGPIPSTSTDEYVAVAPPGSVGIETWIIYDQSGREIERRDGIIPGASSVVSKQRTTLDAHGRVSTIEIRLVAEADRVITSTSYTRDVMGNVVRTERTDFDGTTSEVIASAAEFDSLDRRIVEIDGLGNRYTFRYDSLDRVIERRGPLGHRVVERHDVFGRVEQRHEGDVAADISTVSYDYSDDGYPRVVRRHDHGTGIMQVTNHEYDPLGRCLATERGAGTPVSQIERFGYDAMSNLIVRERPNGSRERRSYDALDRLIRVDVDMPSSGALGGTTFERLEYDALGRVITAETDRTSVRTRHDSFGRAVEEQQSVDGETLSITRTFDSLGHANHLRYPSGRGVALQSDGAGSLRSVQATKSSVGARAFAMTRTSIGLATRSERFSNDVETIRRRDRAGRCLAISHANASGPLLELVHVHDAAGNRRHDWQRGSETHAASIAHRYDGLDRITDSGPSSTPPPLSLGALEPPAAGTLIVLDGQNDLDAAAGLPDIAVVAGYAYDAAGNVVVAGNPVTFDGVDRIASIAHDANGNVLALNGHSLVFDFRDRVVAAPDVGFEAVYDAFGRRVRFGAGALRRIVFDGHADVAEYEDGHLVAETVYGLALDERLLVSINGHDYTVHRDLVGSTRMLVDENGSVVARSDFGPYGVETIIRDDVHLRHRFMGRELDPILGLIHFRARHFDPMRARFVQRDPLQSRSERSAYEAFLGNPFRYVDPLGTRAKSAGDPSVAALVATSTFKFALNALTLGTAGTVETILNLGPGMSPTLSDAYSRDPRGLDNYLTGATGPDLVFARADLVAFRGQRAMNHYNFWVSNIAGALGSVLSGPAIIQGGRIAGTLKVRTARNAFRPPRTKVVVSEQPIEATPTNVEPTQPTVVVEGGSGSPKGTGREPIGYVEALEPGEWKGTRAGQERHVQWESVARDRYGGDPGDFHIAPSETGPDVGPTRSNVNAVLLELKPEGTKSSPGKVRVQIERWLRNPALNPGTSIDVSRTRLHVYFWETGAVYEGIPVNEFWGGGRSP